MKVVYGISRLNQNYRNTVLAIGVFDGVHLGHQHLIQTAVQRAKALKGKAMVMTFFPHPSHVLRPEAELPLLVSLPYRLKLIEKLGVDVCLVVRFTKRFSQMAPEQFIKRYFVQKIKPKEIFVGADFRFGKNRDGGIDLFQQCGNKYGFKIHSVRPVQKLKKVISSTLIRKNVLAGDFNEAARLLGRKVSILGRVVRGDGRGKNLGYPTANIKPYSNTIPPSGVYSVEVVLDSKTYQGVANIGCRPSFHVNGVPVLEVHIFRFNKSIYKKELLVKFIKKIRSEKKFSSQQQLIAQITRDIHKAKSTFLSRKN